MTDPQAEIIIDDDQWASFSESIDFQDIIAKSCVYLTNFNIDDTNFSVLLTNDTKIQQLNHDFRQTNKPTNVLSFPSDGEGYLGDIAIAFETLDKESKEQSKEFKDHFIHLFVHGFLHLLGFDHIEDDEAEEMETLETKILQDMGIKNPYND